MPTALNNTREERKKPAITPKAKQAAQRAIKEAGTSASMDDGLRMRRVLPLIPYSAFVIKTLLESSL